MDAGTIGKVGASKICRELRDMEESLLETIKGDILSLQAAYRYALRWIRCRNAIPRFRDLPVRLRNDRHQRRAITSFMFGTVRESIEDVIDGMCAPTLTPVEDVMYEDKDLERTRRAEIYAKQWDDLEQVHGNKLDEEPQWEPPRAVWTIQPIPFVPADDDLGLFAGLVDGKQVACTNQTVTATHENLRGAARYLTKALGRNVDRCAVRNSIRCGTTIDGIKVGFCDWTSQVTKSMSRAVRCLTHDRDFPSELDAARYYGFSHSKMSRALSAGKKPDGLEFQYITAEEVRPDDIHTPYLFNMMPPKEKFKRAKREHSHPERVEHNVRLVQSDWQTDPDDEDNYPMRFEEDGHVYRMAA